MAPAARYRNSRSESFATEAAIAALGFIAGKPDRLERFLALSGLGPHNLRKAAAEPSFLPAVLDYIIGDEQLLVELAREQGWPPEDIVRAREALGGPPPAEP